MTKHFFDAYEIDQVVEYADGSCEPLLGKDIAHEREAYNYAADYWTLYGHLSDGGVIAIGDFESEAAAQEVLSLITACPDVATLREALELAVAALNTAPRFAVPSRTSDSYRIAATCERVIATAKPKSR